MIFKCGLCEKYKMGKYHLLEFKTLDDPNASMKICETCAEYMQVGGINEEKFRKEIKETDSEIDGSGRSSRYRYVDDCQDHITDKKEDRT